MPHEWAGGYHVGMFSYELRKKGDGVITYTLGTGVRIICAIFALVLLLGIVGAFRAEGFAPSALLPILLCIMLFLVPFYRDEWRFDNNKREALCVYGLGPLSSKRIFAYDDIDAIEIHHFHKGIADGSSSIKPSWRHKEMAALRIRLSGDVLETVNIEVVPARRQGLKLERTANMLASATGLALEIDKEALAPGFRR